MLVGVCTFVRHNVLITRISQAKQTKEIDIVYTHRVKDLYCVVLCCVVLRLDVANVECFFFSSSVSLISSLLFV